MKYTIDHSIHEHPRKKFFLFFIGLLLFAIQLAIYFLAYDELFKTTPVFSYLFPIFLIYLLSKLVFSVFYKPYKPNDYKPSVAILIPFYNEDFEIMKAQYDSLINQTYQNFTIYYVDDGSKNDTTYQKMVELVKDNPKVKIYKKTNSGKRRSQIYLLEKSSEELIYTTDSDTVMDKRCLQELVYPFIDPEIKAVTGQVQTYNAPKNLLTKLLQIRYYSAFESERAAQSYTENVLVCSGPNSVYRRYIIEENIDEYINQKFLGQIQTFGDDRCLTNTSMRYGQTKYQSTAITYTEIPESIQVLTKQQIRWGKSFFRESYFALKNCFIHRKLITMLWTIIEVFMVIVFLTSLTLFFYNLSIRNLNILDISFFFSFTIINAYIRNIYYLEHNFRMYLLSPLYGFLHILWITPLKIYSFFTLTSTKWGTR